MFLSTLDNTLIQTFLVGKILYFSLNFIINQMKARNEKFTSFYVNAHTEEGGRDASLICAK